MPAGKTNWKQRGQQGEGDSNTISKNRLYLLQLCLTGCSYKGPEDLGFQWALENSSWCQKSFSKSLSLSSYTTVLCSQSGSRVWVSMPVKMNAGRAPKATQRVQNSPQHVLQSPETLQLHKLGQGLSWFRGNFLGSPEIILSDLTETQKMAFRVQVWLHKCCINSLLSGQRNSRKVWEEQGVEV